MSKCDAIPDPEEDQGDVASEEHMEFPGEVRAAQVRSLAQKLEQNKTGSESQRSHIGVAQRPGCYTSAILEPEDKEKLVLITSGCLVNPDGIRQNNSMGISFSPCTHVYYFFRISTLKGFDT